MSDSKRCARCDEVKPVSAYGPKRQGRLPTQCRPCASTPQRPDESRRCSRCELVKPLSAYRPTGHDRWHAQCRECTSALQRERYAAQDGHARMIASHRQRRYGLTPEGYAALVESQAGRCAVCLVDLGSLPARDVHVDHDHTTGRVRGLLCHPCNVCVVPAVETATLEVLARAAAYLRSTATASNSTVP